MIPTPSRALLGMHCSCPDRPSSTCDAAVVPGSIAASAPSAHSAPVGANLLVAIYVAIGRFACSCNSITEGPHCLRHSHRWPASALRRCVDSAW